MADMWQRVQLTKRQAMVLLRKTIERLRFTSDHVLARKGSRVPLSCTILYRQHAGDLQSGSTMPGQPMRYLSSAQVSIALAHACSCSRNSGLDKPIFCTSRHIQKSSVSAFAIFARLHITGLAYNRYIPIDEIAIRH